MTRSITVFDAVGGWSWFERLVDEFYDRVSHDNLLRPMYPDDLTESRDHMVKFLAQYWGGPTTYSDERGHPRLRMRHIPFTIGPAERDAWLLHMVTAVQASDLPEDIERQMVEYFQLAANHLVNAET